MQHDCGNGTQTASDTELGLWGSAGGPGLVPWPPPPRGYRHQPACLLPPWASAWVPARPQGAVHWAPWHAFEPTGRYNQLLAWVAVRNLEDGPFRLGCCAATVSTAPCALVTLMGLGSSWVQHTPIGKSHPRTVEPCMQLLLEGATGEDLRAPSSSLLDGTPFAIWLQAGLCLFFQSHEPHGHDSPAHRSHL